MTTMIEAVGITKQYGDALALDEAGFTVAGGEVVALLGANGAGKTTLLKCLLGLLRFQGTARIAGIDVLRDGKRARRSVGYLPQVAAFPAHVTVAEALEQRADLRGLTDEDIDARMAQLGLTAHADKRVGALSGGLRQRLGIAAALLGDPPVLILDEPIASLDPDGQALFRELIAQVRDAGRAVLLSTHVHELLDGVAERAVALVEGRVVYDGALDGLLQPAPRRRRLVLPDAHATDPAAVSATVPTRKDDRQIALPALAGEVL
jgi:ABC-type multidrug transport system ATPase subunit